MAPRCRAAEGQERERHINLRKIPGTPAGCPWDTRRDKQGSTGRLSGPISRDIAIVSLRYSLSRDTFSAIATIPQQGAIPPLVPFFYTDISAQYPILQHIARYLRDTPRKQARKGFAILSLKVSRDMKSIAAGPLSRPVSQGCSVICYRKTDRKGHFCRDTGRVSRGHPAIEGVFRNFM